MMRFARWFRSLNLAVRSDFDVATAAIAGLSDRLRTLMKSHSWFSRCFTVGAIHG